MYEVFEDKEGFLWMGSNEGLYRFDGKNYKQFVNHNYTSSYSGIQQDKLGRIWCTNFSGQLFYLENDTLKLFKDYAHIYLRFPTYTVHCYPQIITSGHSIGKHSVIATHFNSKDTTNLDHLFLNSGFEQNHLNLIRIFRIGDVVVFNHYSMGSYMINSDLNLNEFFRHKDQSLQTEQVYIKNNIVVESIRPFYNGGKYSYRLLISNLNNPNESHLISLNREILNSSYYLQDSSILWIGTEDGIVQYNLKTKTTSSIKSFKGKQVSYIAAHKKGIIISTLNHGLFEIPHLNLYWTETKGKSIENLYAHPEIDLIGASNDGDLFSFDKNGSITKSIQTGLKGKINIYFDPYKGLIHCFHKRPFSLYAKNWKTFPQIPGPESVFKKSEQVNRYTRVCALSQQLNFYISDNGRNHSEKSFEQMMCLTQFKRPLMIGADSLKKYQIGAGRFFDFQYIRIPNHLYFASNTGLLFYHDCTVDTILFKKKPILAKQLVKVKNHILCGSINGGVMEIIGDKQVVNWNSLLHHQFGHVKKIATNGTLIFVLDNKGLFRINYVNQILQKIDIPLGLDPLTITDIEVIENKCYLSTGEGLVFFNQDIDLQSTGKPKTYFEQILVNNLNIDWEQIKTFKHHQANFRFNFRSINKYGSREKRYKYRLIGLNEEWIELDNNNEYAEYNNLAPGNYEFQVFAMDNNNVTSQVPASFSFRITEIFYNTWWFRTIAFLILLMAITIPFYIRYHNLKNQSKLELSVQETEKKLAESKLASLRSQMNPHFIFNALNSIQENIVLQKQDLASTYLGKFADLMRKYLSQSQKTSISLKDEIESLKLYLELEKIRFEDSLEITFEVDERLDLDIIQIPPILIQPYVENALKHGLLHKKGKRLLDIVFRKDGEILYCSIHDNGVGRKRAQDIKSASMKNHKSFATSAAQERLALLNKSRNEKIKVEIVDLHDGTEAMGTIVEIHFPLA